MTKKTIPIFIAHLGCPHDCLFCDQHTITAAEAPTPAQVTRQITEYLATCPTGAEVELAFFGGSFTALPISDIQAYLGAVKPFFDSGAIQSIRCSTRPDAINAEILSLLKHSGVTTVEIGVQSMSEQVLHAVHRGHTAAQSLAAADAILQAGLSLVGQMMLGLPHATLADELATADAIIRMGATGVRIYPTVVFPNTGLARLREQGLYALPSLSEMTMRGAEVLSRFIAAGIPVLRIGLCANEHLAREDQASGYHPAMGELIRARYYQNQLEALLRKMERLPKEMTVLVPSGAASQVAGQHGNTRAYIREKYGVLLSIRECETLPPYQLQIL